MKTKRHSTISILFAFLVLLSLVPMNFIQINGTKLDLNMPPPETSDSVPSLIGPEIGIPVSVVNHTQGHPQLVSDGLGGAIIVWSDERNQATTGMDIYAQRIDSNGSPLWTPNGIAICSLNETQDNPQLVSDDAGGAIITWHDRRNYPDYKIYAQRIDPNGNTLWTANGTSICSDDEGQLCPMPIKDGHGGAIITWMDERFYDIYIQRINSTGNIQWNPEGIPLGIDGEWPQLINDGAGGAIVTWNGKEGTNTYADTFVQKINATGDIQWTPNGTNICSADYDQRDARLISDGLGGAIITWNDDRKYFDTDIYVQKVNSTGNIQWMPNGTMVCSATNYQRRPEIITDGAGGAIITWCDLRSFVESKTDIYAQKIDPNGTSLWTPNGIAICTAIDYQEGVQLASDGKGGTYLVWFDDRGIYSTDDDIYIQSIDSMGNIKWTPNGTALTLSVEPQTFPQIISDQGQIIITWQDRRDRDTTDTDIYAQKVIDNIRPISNHPLSVSTTKYTNETINWVLTDDWGTGQFRVRINATGGTFTTWQDWQQWTNNTALDIPINRTVTGTFNYTIEFDDMYDVYGIPDSVIVHVAEGTPPDDPNPPGGEEDEGSPSISFGYFYLIPTLIGTCILALTFKRRSLKQNGSKKT